MPGVMYWPTIGTTSTKAPVWRARRTSAARSTDASTPGAPECVQLDGGLARPRPRRQLAVPAPMGCTSSGITWRVRRTMPVEDAPDLRTVEKCAVRARWKPANVTNASTSATPTVSADAISSPDLLARRPSAASANRE